MILRRIYCLVHCFPPGSTNDQTYITSVSGTSSAETGNNPRRIDAKILVPCSRSAIFNFEFAFENCYWNDNGIMFLSPHLVKAANKGSRYLFNYLQNLLFNSITMMMVTKCSRSLRGEVLQRSLEEHQQYSSPDREVKQKSWNRIILT